MGIRSSITAVKSLLADDDADVWTMLVMASEFVDDRLSGSGLSPNMLKQIEALLACHYYALGNPDPSRQVYGGSTIEYPDFASMYGMGLKSTKWGNMALALDNSGTLQGLNRQRVRMEII